MLKILGLQGDTDDVEVDWSMGVVWIRDTRTMALDTASLLSGECRVAEVKFSKGLRLPGSCYFNVDYMARLSGTTLSELEVKLRTE